jgi:DNA-binding NarL/FixJ family response regulator
MIIEEQGIRVVAEAATVAEALGASRDVRPDAALVDVGLPDGDGDGVALAMVAESLSSE